MIFLGNERKDQLLYLYCTPNSKSSKKLKTIKIQILAHKTLRQPMKHRPRGTESSTSKEEQQEIPSIKGKVRGLKVGGGVVRQFHINRFLKIESRYHVPTSYFLILPPLIMHALIYHHI